MKEWDDIYDWVNVTKMGSPINHKIVRNRRSAEHTRLVLETNRNQSI